MKKVIIILVILAVLVGVAMLSSNKEKAIDVEIQNPQMRNLETLTLASGTINYGDERRLRSQVVARVEKVLVKEGDFVEAEQLLAQLDQEQIKSDLLSAKASVTLRKIDIERGQINLANLRKNLKRQQGLFAKGVVNSFDVESIEDQIALAKVDLKAAKEQLVQAQANFDKVNDNLSKTAIRAPIKGVVSRLDIRAGEMAGSNDATLMTVADTAEIYTKIEVDEADIGLVDIGQPVRVFAVAYPDTALSGVVDNIATSARQASGRAGLTFTVEILITDKKGLIIRPGMSSRAEIITQVNNNSLSVPIQALLKTKDDDEKDYLFVMNNGIAEQRFVTLGKADDSFWQILGGLEEADQVITGPARNINLLSTGTAVKALEPDEEKTLVEASN